MDTQNIFTIDHEEDSESARHDYVDNRMDRNDRNYLVRKDGEEIVKEDLILISKGRNENKVLRMANKFDILALSHVASGLMEAHKKEEQNELFQKSPWYNDIFCDLQSQQYDFFMDDGEQLIFTYANSAIPVADLHNN